jgi:hypothetical protein
LYRLRIGRLEGVLREVALGVEERDNLSDRPRLLRDFCGRPDVVVVAYFFVSVLWDGRSGMKCNEIAGA